MSVLDKIPFSEAFITSITSDTSRYEERIENQMTWLKQILEVAKEKFEKPGLPVLPKTPQKKGARRKINQNIDSLTSPTVPVRNTRSARAAFAKRKFENEDSASNADQTQDVGGGKSLRKYSKHVVGFKETEDKAGSSQEQEISQAAQFKCSEENNVDVAGTVSNAVIVSGETEGMVEGVDREIGAAGAGGDYLVSSSKDPIIEESSHGDPKSRLSRTRRVSRKSAARKRSTMILQGRMRDSAVEIVEAIKCKQNLPKAQEEVTEEERPSTRTRARTKQKQCEGAEDSSRVASHSSRVASPVAPTSSALSHGDITQISQQNEVSTPKQEAPVTNQESTEPESVASSGRRVTRSRLRTHTQQTTSTTTKSPNCANKTRHLVRTPSPAKNVFGGASGSANKGSSIAGLYKLKGVTPGNLNTGAFSFIKRTPQKLAQKDEEEARQKLLKAQQREKEVLQKKDDLLRQKMQESKKKREARALRVAQVRKEQERRHEEQRVRLEQKHNSQKKLKEIAGDPEINKKQTKNIDSQKLREQEEQKQKKLEEKKRKEDMEQKAREQEKMEKQQKRIEREKEELRKIKEREKKEEELRKAEQEKERQRILRLEREEQERSLQDKELSSAIKKHNISAAALQEGKKSKNQASVSLFQPNISRKQSYDMTPLREKKPSTDNNYCIDDLNSGDETDDEDNPRKRIPFWAQGAQLKSALIQQYYSPPDLEELFGKIFAPELSVMFVQQRKRFHKRTSSAIWDSPLLPRPSVPSSKPVSVS